MRKTSSIYFLKFYLLSICTFLIGGVRESDTALGYQRNGCGFNSVEFRHSKRMYGKLDDA